MRRGTFFFELQIFQIDETPVVTAAEVLAALRSHLPTFDVKGESCIPLFGTMTLPPGVKDLAHISLGNFPDFRIDRSVNNDLDLNKVAKAIDLEQQTLCMELSEKDFEIIIATKKPEIIACVKAQSLIKSNVSVSTAPTVGVGRDAIINLKPNASYQSVLGNLSKAVFGKDFVLWNSLSQPVPYHLSVAQTHRLTAILDSLPLMVEEKRANFEEKPQPKLIC